MYKDKQSYVYLMASKRNGTLYLGSTTNLIKRVWQHKNNTFSGFTSKYKIYKLVYYAAFPDLESALLNEKRMKNWRRAWKINLIEENNPYWNDLYTKIL